MARKRSDSPWNAELDRQMTKLRHDNHSYRAIAEILGLTENQVIGRAERIGLREATQRDNRSTRPRRVASNPFAAENTSETNTVTKRKPQRDPQRAARSARSANSTNKLRRKLGLATDERFIPRLASTDGLRFRSCQYIEGNPMADDSCKCGSATDGGPWCERHRQGIWVAGTALNQEPTYVSRAWR